MEFTGYSHNVTDMEEALKITKIDSPDNCDEQCDEDFECEHSKQSSKQSSKTFGEDSDVKLSKEDMESSIKRKVIDELIEQLEAIRDNSDELKEYKFKHTKKSVKKFRKTNKL